jgi:NTE family protein
MTTAFVLSGGASLGAVQVGMLQALSDAGVGPDLLVGSSVGAINAAWVAVHPESEGLEALVEIWRTLRRSTVFPVSPLLGAAAVTGLRNYFVSPDGLRGLLERYLPFRRLEEARIPLHVVATDLATGRGVVLSHGAAIPALLASAAIPGVFPPVRIGGRDLVDGGVADYAPISQAVALGADRVYVLPAAHACALASPPRSALAMALHSLNLMIESRMAADVERLCDEVELHVLPHPCPLSVSPADFSHSGELIERAHRCRKEPVGTSIPTLIFFVDGEAVATVTGFAGPGEVKSWAAELMKLVADGSESWRPPQSALPSRDEQNTGNEAAPWTSEIEPLQTLAGFEAVRVGCMADRVTGSRRKSDAWVQDQETSSPPTSLAH